jgi:PAS domain S-box-containing protein
MQEKDRPPAPDPQEKLENHDTCRHILFDVAPMGVLLYDSQGQVLSANQYLLDMLGSPSLEATKSINVFCFENLIRSGISQVLGRVLETGVTEKLDCAYLSKWGKELHLNIWALPMPNRAGVSDKGIILFQDTTALKKYQDSFLRSEARFKLLVERTPIGIAIVNDNGIFEFVNPMFRDIFECSSEEIDNLETWFAEILPNQKIRSVIESLIYDDGTSEPGNFTVLTKDGKRKEVRLRSFPCEGKRVVICEDNSELFRALLGQRVSERRYLGLLEDLTDFVYTLDLEGRILSVNRAAAKSLGYEPEEVIGQLIENIIPTDVRSHIRTNLNRTMKEGVAEGVSQYAAKDGVIHYLEYRSTIIAPDNKPSYIVGIARDITDRILIKRALRESEIKFKLIVETAHDGIVHVNEDGLVLFCNQRMKEILKDRAPEGKPLGDYFNVRNREILERQCQIRTAGENSTFFITLQDLEGGAHKMVVSGAPYLDEQGVYRGSIGIYTDISDIRKLEDQLQQSQKMEAIGTLAGGIAHDFNNILSGVLGYISLLKRHVTPCSQIAHYVEMIEKSAERGALLAGQLLAFGRKKEQFVQDVNVHELMDEVLEILERTLDRNITVKSRKNAPVSTIGGDAGRIQQVLMNLCINAKDAMPAGGELALSTDLVLLDENFCFGHDHLSPGLYVQIDVSDTGEGMPEDVAQRVFEPFFTTKEEGKGTGLGLSMAYGNVQSHGGVIKIKSEPGKGSTFTVFLPLKDPRPDIAHPNSEVRLFKGAGTILVADDEEIIRHLLSEMLQELGFAVITAFDGQEALEIYTKHWTNIDIVLLDIIMPRLNGREALIQMKKVNPDVKAILSSGHSREDSSQSPDCEICGFINKPYNVDKLSQVLGKALDQNSTDKPVDSSATKMPPQQN